LLRRVPRNRDHEHLLHDTHEDPVSFALRSIAWSALAPLLLAGCLSVDAPDGSAGGAGDEQPIVVQEPPLADPTPETPSGDEAVEPTPDGTDAGAEAEAPSEATPPAEPSTDDAPAEQP
jgi:hypothetical protein